MQTESSLPPSARCHEVTSRHINIGCASSASYRVEVTSLQAAYACAQTQHLEPANDPQHHVCMFAQVRRHAANVFSPKHVWWHRLQDKTEIVSEVATVHHLATCCDTRSMHSTCDALTQNCVCQSHAQGRACTRESNMSEVCCAGGHGAVMSHDLSSCPPVEAAMTCSSSVPRNSACNGTMMSATLSSGRRHCTEGGACMAAAPGGSRPKPEGRSKTCTHNQHT